MAMLAGALRYEMQWLRQRLTQIEKSPADLARWLEIPPPRVYEMLKGRRRLQQGEIGKTAQFLKMPEADVLALVEGRPPKSVQNGTINVQDGVINTQTPGSQIDAPQAGSQASVRINEERQQGTGRLTGDVREDPVEFRWLPGKLPVFAATDMGGGIVSVSEKPSENDALPRFAWDIPGVFGIFTVTEEMSPAYERGDRPLVNPSKPVREGDDVLILTGEVGKGGTPRAALRRLVAITPTHWRVKQWNPPKIEKFDRKEWPIAFRVESKRNR
jgi:hypothetical protein